MTLFLGCPSSWRRIFNFYCPLFPRGIFCGGFTQLIFFDVYCRLCQDIVLVKSEVSELLFSNVIVNIAGRKDSDVDLCKVISLKVICACFLHNHSFVLNHLYVGWSNMTWCIRKPHLVCFGCNYFAAWIIY